MSKEFYNYISKRLILYFEKNDKNILHGARYCLVLDNQEAVDKFNNLFFDYAKECNELGKWHYTHPTLNNITYETFTLKFENNEIVIVPKTLNMTEDFLATLRNSKVTMLMITASPIDSISKGTDNLSSKGFPFHNDSLVDDIISNIKNSMLSEVDKEILKFEIRRHKENIFYNNNSIFEYKKVIEILNNKPISKDDFINFRLFYDEELSLFTDKILASRIKENNQNFEIIDKTIKYGNTENDLDKIYDTKFINKLSNKDETNWFDNLSYKDVLRSINIKESNKDNPLEVVECLVYEGLSNTIYQEDNIFKENENFFICTDGTTASKMRIKNILIFNSTLEKILTFEIKFSRILRTDEVKSIDITNTRILKNKILVSIEHKMPACSFHNIKVNDNNSKTIKYNIKICVIDIHQKYFKSLVSLYKIKYTKKKSSLILMSNNNDDDNSIIINYNENNIINNTKDYDIAQGETYDCDKYDSIRLNVNKKLLDETTTTIDFSILINNITIPITLNNNIKKPLALTSIDAFKLKNLYKNSFKRLGNNLFNLGTTEYFTNNDFLNNLNLEHTLINDEYYYLDYNTSGNMNNNEFCLPESIKKAYANLISYYKNSKLLPSLTYYNKDLKILAQNYIKSIDDFFKTIEYGTTLSTEVKNILKLGTIQNINNINNINNASNNSLSTLTNNTKSEICLTPLSPLVVCYQLELLKENSLNNINDKLLQKLSCSNLLPYIQDENKILYKSIDYSQNNSLEWVYFAPVDDKNYKGAKYFVSNLVYEKIREYISHFKYLFQEIDNKEFKINILNMGDCREVLIGIIKFFAKELKNNFNIDKTLKFIINIYLEDNFNNKEIKNNAFSVLVDFNILKNFIENCGIKFNNDYNSRDIANILTQKIKCFFKSASSTKYEYAHITFYEINSKAEIGRTNSTQIRSGLMLDGLLSSVPSVYYGDQYKTTFGLKYASTNSNLVNFASHFNSLHEVFATSNPYDKNTSLSTEVDKLSFEYMDKIYKSSNWVTFIDPKVDLNFFKSEDSNLLIIHYSDQYTTSSSYDAITVTKKSTQYKYTIAEFFKNKNISVTDENIYKIIGMFNCINGDWLLKLVSSNRQFPREKISILAAIKIALAYYYHKNITWIPLSLEEILRVSGAVGLSKSDGLLSAKNLNFEKGPTNDDILLVGIENINNLLHIYIQPIEVKIGNTNSMLNKAKIQVKHTADEFLKILLPRNNSSGELINSLEAKLIKNFIMQLVISTAEKLELYDVLGNFEDFNNNYFSKITRDYRQKLLNDDFIISTNLKKYIHNGCIIAFNNSLDENKSKVTISDDIEIIQISEQLSAKYLSKEILEISELIESIFDTRLKYIYNSEDLNILEG